MDALAKPSVKHYIASKCEVNTFVLRDIKTFLKNGDDTVILHRTTTIFDSFDRDSMWSKLPGKILIHWVPRDSPG